MKLRYVLYINKRWTVGIEEVAKSLRPHLQKMVILLDLMAHISKDAKKSTHFISNSLIRTSKGTRLVGKIRSVRFLTSDVALMHVVGGTIMAGQTDIEPERNSGTDTCGYERQ